MKQLLVWFGVLVGMIILAAWLQNGGLKLPKSSISSAPTTKTMKIGDKTISIEIAQTTEEKAKGLSERDLLAPDSGMLFIMQKNSTPSFWMKGMKIPLDMIWIDDNKVVDISEKAQVPDARIADPDLPRYKPTKQIDYVLEVNSGYAKQNGIKIGTTVELPAGIE